MLQNNSPWHLALGLWLKSTAKSCHRRGRKVRRVEKKGSNAETPKQPAFSLMISHKTPKPNAETTPKQEDI